MAFGPRPKPLADRFWPKVRKGAPDECWPWMACVDQYGYGSIGHGSGSRNIKSHRASWLIHFGEVPEANDVRHRCKNPTCVNPGHLYLEAFVVGGVGRTVDTGRKSRALPKALHKKHGPEPRPFAERLAEKIELGAPSGCWLWSGSADRKGYGRIDGKLVHRASWRVHRGDIPEDLNVLHRCDTPACCNPAHLFIGTIADNNADMRAKGRQSQGESHSVLMRGEANGYAKLTDDAVRQIRADRGTIKEIAERFNIHFTTVSDVRRRKRWRHVTGEQHAA